MPSAWSSRFLPSAGGSSAQSTPSRNGRTNSRDKPSPRPEPGSLQSPTLSGRDGERSVTPSAPTPSNGRPHQHTRSSSHPLPRIFGKKKSAGNLQGYHDIDVPLDDGLIPVLDDSAAATPTRAVSGKKSRVDDGDKVGRKCMCCDSKVNVPRNLVKFRCMGCLTINDLIPVEAQIEDGRNKSGAKRQEPTAANSDTGRPAITLSPEKTRAIIDRCVLSYLETCGKQASRPAAGGSRTLSARTPDEQRNPLDSSATRSRGNTVPALDAPIESPLAEDPLDDLSAAMRDFGDYDRFAHEPVRPSRQRIPPSQHGPGPPNSSERTPSNRAPEQVRIQPPILPYTTTERRPSQGPLDSPHAEQATSTSAQSPGPSTYDAPSQDRYSRAKAIFRPLEDYIVATFGDPKVLGSAFSTNRPAPQVRARSEDNLSTPPPETANGKAPSPINLSQLDAKTLLLGDIGENSTWWTGRLGRNESDNARRKRTGDSTKRKVSARSPNINWSALDQWYELVHCAGNGWRDKLQRVRSSTSHGPNQKLQGPANEEEIEVDLAEGRAHVIRVLLKVTENILKRPSRPLVEPEHVRFLLLMLANPSLYPTSAGHRKTALNGSVGSLTRAASDRKTDPNGNIAGQLSPGRNAPREGSPHSGILKRIFGLLAGSSDICHRYLIGWLARFEEDRFTDVIDLVASFVTNRIAHRSSRSQNKNSVTNGGLIPDLSGSTMNTSAQLHSAMGLTGVGLKREDADRQPSYASDWQVKAAAKLMSLLFAANNIWQGTRRIKGTDRSDSGIGTRPQARSSMNGQLLHTSSFYNTLLDYQDMILDFKLWETKKDEFAFCQYPLFLSMGTKIKILEYDARRQMEIKAREAYFDSVIRQRALDGYFHLRVRRDCMVDDSLRQISEAVGAGQEELKKGLRVHFAGEEGVDAGGLRKEWFLMLVRDIFDQNHGLFIYDDESNTCYFNPNSFETSDQYYLVGALLGLAIYNSTILDIAFPPFAFRKLLAAAPPSTGPGASTISSLTGTKGQMTYTLSDLAEFRPSLAAGLQQLLDFDGDVQETYCRDFVAPTERYGVRANVPLISDGENIPVTNANRQDFVDAYVKYLLDTAVARQFEPFKRGFFQVCAGNALSLFRAEEIELLVRGSDEPLDIDSLRAVAVYENWREPREPHQTVQEPAESVPVIQWFWQLFSDASPHRQRKLLAFITGTDRIPAVGATSLILRIVAGGDGWGGGGQEERVRFPIARTCFNMLVLWRYDYREQLENKLWRAVDESEGFGLK